MKYFLIELSYFMFWPSFFCFALKLFRFPLKMFIPQIAFSSMLLTQISMLLQTTNLAYFMSILHFTCTLLCMWLIFRIRLLFATVMMLLSYFVASITEYAVNFVIPNTYITFVTMDNMYLFFMTTILNIAIINFFTLFINTLRIGFSYISRSGKPQHLQFVGSPAIKLSLFIGLLIAALSSVFYFLVPKALFVVTLALFILLSVLLRKSYSWEMGE